MWAEELRWLDHGQRLLHRQRNVSAAPALHDGATAARLFERMLAGGAAAAGLPAWGLVPGARADLLVLDLQAPGLLGMPASHALFDGGRPGGGGQVRLGGLQQCTHQEKQHPGDIGRHCRTNVAFRR